jgi:hypothetical protein
MGLFTFAALLAPSCGSTGSDASSSNANSGGAMSEAGAPTDEPNAGAAHGAAGATGECEDFTPYGNVYWGELHLHTSYSLDSYMVGNRNTPDDAYAFARGAELSVNAGEGGTTTLELERPLDFAAVTDHSEFLAITGQCTLQNDESRYCQNYRDQGSAAQLTLTGAALAQLASPTPRAPTLCSGPRGAETCAEAALDAWQRTQAATEAANEPCRFSALHGYEWTATTGGANLHRNVIFASERVPELPLDYISYPTPLLLWQALDEQCREQDGCRALTIPHNSNSSYGTMWETVDDPEAVPLMQKYQRLVELFQHKGNSECSPDSELADPECDFEIVEGSFLPDLGRDVGRPESAPGYVRSGLARGLSLASEGGENPLMMGLIGATDTHNGTPGAVAEDNFQGHLAAQDDTAEGRLQAGTREFNPGGLAGVWATENTRAAIFDALERRATFATSGPRIVLRFFAVDGLASDEEAAQICTDPEFPKLAFERGAVWMGSEISSASSPYLFTFALKDEASLEQIDIVRLSSDATGTTSVSIESFPLDGSASAQSCVFFRDPAFDPDQPTLYYARAFEEPTPRWSHYDCEASDAPDCSATEELDVLIRERAWSSPIFFR